MKSGFKFTNYNYFLVAILLIASFFAIKSSHIGLAKSAHISQAVATTSAEELNPSAKPTESPKPQNEIPINYGKSIRIPILMYHYIGKNPNPADKLRDNLSVDPEIFDAQMGYLASKGYQPISLDTMYAGLKGNTNLPSKPIIITFDDGYVDLYLNAFPILKKYHFKAVAFIPTGLIGTTYYATWPQITEMHSSGLISMEAHTVHHLSLITISHPTLTQEITESKKTLEARLGVPVNFMAYPYGTSNSTLWSEVAKVGYLGALGTWLGSTVSEGTIYDMPRIKIPGGLSIQDFASRI